MINVLIDFYKGEWNMQKF